MTTDPLSQIVEAAARAASDSAGYIWGYMRTEDREREYKNAKAALIAGLRKAAEFEKWELNQYSNLADRLEAKP